jgi:hypothetical protein
MSVPGYMTTVKNLAAIFGAVREAGVPERFTHQFLKELGFTSSADRSVIPLMKSLRFLDESGVPTDRYKQFRDPAIGGAVMADALRDAYGDLFQINEAAQTLTATGLKGAFKRISGKGDAVAEKMATTFKALAGLADWSSAGAAAAAKTGQAAPVKPSPPEDDPPRDEPGRVRIAASALHHDIHVHLPTTTDVKVYDAIFRSLRDNLA